MGGRVVECARLESVLGLNSSRGFESLPIRHSGLLYQTLLRGFLAEDCEGFDFRSLREHIERGDAF